MKHIPRLDFLMGCKKTNKQKKKQQKINSNFPTDFSTLTLTLSNFQSTFFEYFIIMLNSEDGRMGDKFTFSKF